MFVRLRTLLLAGHRAPEAAEGKGDGREGDFLLLRTISNFIYEMVKNPGENCQGWQFYETQGMDAFRYRPGRFYGISPFH